MGVLIHTFHSARSLSYTRPTQLIDCFSMFKSDRGTRRSATRAVISGGLAVFVVQAGRETARVTSSGLEASTWHHQLEINHLMRTAETAAGRKIIEKENELIRGRLSKFVKN